MERSTTVRRTAPRLVLALTLAALAAACADTGGTKAWPKRQNVVTGELPGDQHHRHWWKTPGYASFGGH
ncbi:MAG: hypothetical protein ACE5H8_11785 [Alphaproteobacteria bacterium]